MKVGKSIDEETDNSGQWVPEEADSTLLVEEDVEDEIPYQIDEYELVSSPNDFNIVTIYNFIESGAVVIPGFQRNYVWDQKRASKLIESIILGLPIPQIFLYEEDRDKYLVIDGQQRLMSIYYFVKGRFPRQDRRSNIRTILAETGSLSPEVLADDAYFSQFNLRLPSLPNDKPNIFSGLSYESLDNLRRSFDLRTIRNVIVKQVSPKNDKSAIHEIFNRLNTGGINLTPQEIRASLYHSDFYDMLARINEIDQWRAYLNLKGPDVHMKDIEVLLRGFAVLLDHQKYRAPMVRFLDEFSADAKKFDRQKIDYLEHLFGSFVESLANVPKSAFLGESKRFNVSLFEAVFTAASEKSLSQGVTQIPDVNPALIEELSEDQQFVDASTSGTTNRGNVLMRLDRARVILNGDQTVDSAVI